MHIRGADYKNYISRRDSCEHRGFLKKENLHSIECCYWLDSKKRKEGYGKVGILVKASAGNLTHSNGVI
jgi:hypothetical protein